jgi:hypothetical protein
MNNLSLFKNKENLQLLWEVLLDELHIQSQNTKLISNIYTIFESNINPFQNRANQQMSIIDLNKQFLQQVVLAVNRLFPNLKQEPNIKRITITDEEVAEPYKIEDIHAVRQTDFEKALEKQKIELENYMSPPKPRELNFSDRKVEEGKITAMDSLLADKMAERNLDMENIQATNYNTSAINPDQWLSSKETSVKNEKLGKEPNLSGSNHGRLKYINMDNDVVTLNNSTQKKVTWDLEDPINKTREETASIFQKLKTTTTVKPEQMIERTADSEQIDQKKYIEQPSMSLPKPESLPTLSINQSQTQSNIVLQQPPIIPNAEFIKQLNTMNDKIDQLYTMIFSLQELLRNNTESEKKIETQDDSELETRD